MEASQLTLGTHGTGGVGKPHRFQADNGGLIGLTGQSQREGSAGREVSLVPAR
jgi:hypothetical protein